MRILRLAAENFKVLKAIELELDPAGGLVMITGKNGAGKTCTMDIVSACLGGKKLCPEKPIREGEKSAEIEVETEDWTVTRTFREGGGSTLKVVKADGCIVPKGQTFLDTVVGSIAFDPLQFVNDPDPKKQRKTLLDLVGVDLTELDGKIKALREQRTAVGRTLIQAEAEVKAAETFPDAPDEEISAGELAEEYRKAVEHNQLILNLQKDRETYESEVDRLTKAVELAKCMLDGVNMNLEESNLIDSKDMAEKVEVAEETNRQVRANVTRRGLVAQSREVDAKYNDLTFHIQEAERSKVDTLEDADMPVKGLSVDESGVTFNGIPIAQIAMSEKIKVGLAVSMALNPTLKVLLIRDGSLLDADNIKLIEKMVKGKGFQAFIEKVDEHGDGKVGFVIEEGRLKENG